MDWIPRVQPIFLGYAQQILHLSKAESTTGNTLIQIRFRKSEVSSGKTVVRSQRSKIAETIARQGQPSPKQLVSVRENSSSSFGRTPSFHFSTVGGSGIYGHPPGRILEKGQISCPFLPWFAMYRMKAHLPPMKGQSRESEASSRLRLTIAH